MASVADKINSDQSLLQNPGEISRVASTSFNVTKASDLQENYDLMYPAQSHSFNKTNTEPDKIPSRRQITTSHYKSPYNMHNKNKIQGSGKKRSIESDPKELSTNVPNTHNSDSRYKTQLLAKAEVSCRLPDSNTREETKSSKDTLVHPSNFMLTSELQDMLGPSDSLHTDQSNLASLLKRLKDQERAIEEYKSNEVLFKDRIFDLEKKLKEAIHKLELTKLDHEREVSGLTAKLEKKNEELAEHMENFIMNKLDLDEYGLTSDDFRRSSQSSAARVRSEDTRSRAIRTQQHPLVPKLDLQKIFDWREKQNNDNIIMIRISESRLLGEDAITEEIDDEKGIEIKHKKYFAKGDKYTITSTRMNELFERKQMIINALNSAYTEEGESTVSQQDMEDTI